MYIKRTVRAGRTIEVEKYYSARWGVRGGHRAAHTAPTGQTQAAANERRAVCRLRWLLNENFRDGDLHAVLTYREDNRPDEQQARQNMEKLLRVLRKTAKKMGTELRYIHTTEYRNAAIHHHLIVSGVTLEQLRTAWPHGGVHVTPLYGGEYPRLAEYIVKETRKTFREGRRSPGGDDVSAPGRESSSQEDETERDAARRAAPFAKRWCASRNLRKPQIRVEAIPAETWSRSPRPLKGYMIVPDSIEMGTHEETGMPWMRYRMRRIE